MNAATDLRLKLLSNGFTPLPNTEKRCLLKGWPFLVVDEATVRKWGRFRKYPDSGIRLDRGLCVIDIDIDETSAVERLVERLAGLLPGSLQLVRHGNGAKIAIFVRTSEPFDRVTTRRWIKPGETEDGGAHGVEIFGGKSARQFGAFGRCSREKTYRWGGRSPLDTRFNQLPIFLKRQFFSVLDAAEEVLKQSHWRAVECSVRGENISRPVRDLTDDMRFECSDGVTRALADLEELAKYGGLHDLRCSASWLEGPSARRTDRCLIGDAGNGHLTIWETSTGITHMRRTEIDQIIDEKLREISQGRPSTLEIIDQEWARRIVTKKGTRT